MSDDWGAHYASGNGFRYWPNEALVRHVGARKFDAVLEVGCGNGANLWFLAEHAERVLGIDGSDAAIAAAHDYVIGHRAASRRVALLRASAPPLPCDDGEFDLIVDCMTSQHVGWADHAALYAEYGRALKVGGELFLFHMDGLTRRSLMRRVGTFDYDVVGGFSGAPIFCLPHPGALVDVLVEAGFGCPNVNGIMREYDNGESVHYSVITAENHA